MAIKYYPNRVYKGKIPAIDREMAKRAPITVTGGQNINASAIDEYISTNDNWQIDSISFQFSNVTARNYSVKIANGRRVVTNLNDYLWFLVPTTLWQRIILDEGFYTGTQLAAELQSKMNANTAYTAAGITFTVAYDNITGLFTITPSSGTIQYLDVNTTQTIRTRDSIAGHLFGFTQDTSFAASISNDTTVKGLDTEAAIINETADILIEVYHDDLHTLSIDQALHIETNSGVDVNVNYAVVYEELV